MQQSNFNALVGFVSKVNSVTKLAKSIEYYTCELIDFYISRNVYKYDYTCINGGVGVVS